MAEARGPLVGRGRICPLLDSLTAPAMNDLLRPASGLDATHDIQL